MTYLEEVAQAKAYYWTHREALLAQKKLYRKSHAESINAAQRRLRVKRRLGIQRVKGRPRLPLILRFMSKIRIDERCWEWQGACDESGYGEIRMRPGKSKAHRVSYLLFKGAIPDGWCVLHHCDNPPCVNPRHLFLGTKQDNVIDMMNKGRHASQKID